MTKQQVQPNILFFFKQEQENPQFTAKYNMNITNHIQLLFLFIKTSLKTQYYLKYTNSNSWWQSSVAKSLTCALYSFFPPKNQDDISKRTICDCRNIFFSVHLLFPLLSNYLNHYQLSKFNILWHGNKVIKRAYMSWKKSKIQIKIDHLLKSTHVPLHQYLPILHIYDISSSSMSLWICFMNEEM